MPVANQEYVTGLNVDIVSLESTTQTITSKSKIYSVKLVQDEDGRFVATVPELQGVISDGATKEEAMANVHEAAEAMLESMGQQKMFMLVAS